MAPQTQTAFLEAVDATPEATPEDEELYRRIVKIELDQETKERIRTPEHVYPRQRFVLAIHWHSEHVPLELIRARLDAAFPGARDELVIPTNHNVLTAFGAYAGAEVDCYSRPFRRKVQLLVHFEKERVADADAFRSMLAHTFRYRASQLYEFFDSLLEERFAERRAEAAHLTGADDELIGFVQLQTGKLRELLADHESETPREAIRNKLIKWFFEGLSERFDPRLIRRCQTFIQQVKLIVKDHFSPEYFYETDEVIEEVRALGGGIVVPHPEQFWPILLADYDVDGYEVWNPQSHAFTEFLVNVVRRQNKLRAPERLRLLVTMGDDCHMGEKAKEPSLQDPAKARREVGVQPAWDDLMVRKSLMLWGMSRERVIEEYRARLAG